MTTKVEKSIQVDVPVTTAYDQWTQFESFPQFMGGISEVRQITDTQTHWVAEIAGAVYFAPVGAGQTLVRLVLEFQPEGLVEKAGDVLGIVEKQAEGDLERFKAFIEARGSETGAWRGEVPGTMVGTPGVEQAAASVGDSGKAGTTTAAKVAGLAAAAVGVAAAATLAGGKEQETTTTPAVAPVDVEPVVAETVVVETTTTTDPYPAADTLSPLPTDTQVR